MICIGKETKKNLLQHFPFSEEKIHAAFLDWKEAFSLTNRNKLWEKLNTSSITRLYHVSTSSNPEISQEKYHVGCYATQGYAEYISLNQFKVT